MMQMTRTRLVLTLVAACSCSAPAHAQEEPLDEEAPADAKPLHLATQPVAAPPAESTTRIEPEPEPDTLGPFERLPLTAYPNRPVRGLRGGSLWQTFHGLQWPYYPKTGIAVSGYGWIDTGYERVTRGNA